MADENKIAPIPEWAKRIKEAFAETGWSMAELSRRSGVSYDSLNKYLRGEVAQPRGDALDKVSKTLSLDPVYVREGLTPGPIVTETSIPIRGKVAAGVWLEVGAIDDDPTGWIPFNPLPQFPKGSVFALIVEGDSLDLIAKDGATIICTDLGLTGVSLRENDVAILEHRKGQEGIRQVTAKRISLQDGELWLIPQSSNPRWQTQRFRLSDCCDDTEIRVIARVEYILQKP